MTAHDMLTASRTRANLAAGFPARFHFRVELWSIGGLFGFSHLERSIEYDVLVHFIALERVYQVVLAEKERPPFSLGKFARVEDAERAVARPTRVPITAPAGKRFMYYQVTLEASNIQISDLDDLNRWLNGELRPAMSGNRNPGTALTRGLKSIIARLLGGSSIEYKTTSPTFRVP
ncbi:MAG TPA: hypothetical protein VHE78_03415 [Gemmatimonadaceae bacterium]|nr:hypothetical protein [Gemmatimonadaceae bacterium]